MKSQWDQPTRLSCLARCRADRRRSRILGMSILPKAFAVMFVVLAFYRRVIDRTWGRVEHGAYGSAP